MILTENNNVIYVYMDLMFESQPVAELRLEFSSFSAYIDVLSINTESLLPEIVLNNKLSIPDFLVSRCLSINNHRNIYFIRLVINGETRHKMMPMLLSLSTNSVSLSDKYWLNPKETTELILNGAKILFERKSWEQVDPFKNPYHVGELEQYGLYDSFFVNVNELVNPKSLIWSISGHQNKRWIYDSSGYCLEKKLYKHLLEDELTTLDFFASNGILTPEYNYYIEELNDPAKCYRQTYNMDTILGGLCVIQKKCLTNSTNYLDRLSYYVDNDVDIDAPITKMCKKHGVDESETKHFITIVNLYQKQFNVNSNVLDTRNIGLLIQKDCAIPVVWGRLNRQMLWNGQLDN